MVTAVGLLAVVLVVLVAQRLLELRFARANERWARAEGAVEFGAKHYWVFFVLHPAWMLATVAEALHRGPELGRGWPLWLTCFVVAGALRYWAIATLGTRWNTKVLVLPGRAPLEGGPYRWLRHPNYVAVGLELASVPLMFGAVVSAVLFSAINAVILLGIRIPCEMRALRWAVDTRPSSTPEATGHPRATPEE